MDDKRRDKDEETKKAAGFEADQKARQEKFEQESSARKAQADRAAKEDEAARAKAEKIAAARKECDDQALAEGRITADEIVTRDAMLATERYDRLLPWQVLEGEGRVRMAFDRHVNIIMPPHHHKLFFSKGYDDVPESLVNHPSLAQVARRADSRGKVESEEERASRLRSEREKATRDDARRVRSTG